ncbi:MAG TPA: cytochrome c biogenesis protein CcdA [Saprospiraceae bacterium]|nr:cytochrome c biogenesis protein CcdA [Saprospiraceae bacterium]HMQ83732.1 cytochrome c biogenesis protein CcdA [Saprospiraceae bacterium]
MRLSLAIVFSICSLSAFAQLKNPVKWTFDQKSLGNDEFELVFSAKIEEPWKVYSQYLESEDGPIPTSFNFEPGAHFELAGKNAESDNRVVTYDKVFEMNLAYFKKYATFKQKIKVKDYSKPVTGYLEFMTCNDEECLPPTAIDFSFTLSAPAKETPQKEDIKDAKTNTTEVKTTQAPTLSTETSPLVLPENGKSLDSKLENPVHWTYSSKKLDNGQYELAFEAKLDQGWTLPAMDTDPNDGPMPTTFNFEPSSSFSLVGKMKEEGKKKKAPDQLFNGAMVSKFVESPVRFTQIITADDATKPVTGYIAYMVCDDNQCLPQDAEFAFNLETGVAALPSIDQASGLPLIDQTVASIRASYTQPVGNCGEEDVARDANLLWTFILGFGGGLLALLTPCVFPMIPLTVSFFTKGSKDRKSGFRNAIIYGLSIIAIYVSIGLIITGVFGATALNTLSTDWIANTLFFLIFLFFAFSFFGYYEITLPSSWANKSDSMADKGGLIGIFFMAFTLALVSFSCTGPIIGSALVQSATNTAGPFTVMLGFSTALALPFGLFAAFPGWLNSLPKSGGWMNSVKVVLGFLELALAFKFLSVADMTMHWGILPYEVFMAVWVILFAAMSAYLFGLIRFPHDSPLKKLSPLRATFALLSLVFTVYLASGFIYNDKTNSYQSLKLMSGLAPPTQYNLFLPDPKVDTDIKSKYPSFTKCANNLDCFKSYEEGVAYAKETGKPILLDFTGYGCVNCRKTEEHIWIVDKVRNRIEQDFVLVSLYVDDRKPLEEVLLSAPRQEKLRNVGNKWADFQIVNFEQNSQPLYVMMTPDEKVLAAPRGFKEGANDYATFLECGLDTYKNLIQ